MPAGMPFVVRVEMHSGSVDFGQLAMAIAAAGGDVVAVDLVRAGRERTVRDITCRVKNPDVMRELAARLEALPGTRVVNISDRTFLTHLGGKIEVTARTPIKNRDDLSMVYTPGVARVALAIAQDPAKAFQLTIKRNTVAVVTDGSAVLGLGDIGPLGALPVMEGKCQLFKELGGVDAFPICLTCHAVEEIVETVANIASGFGGINLEDISSPRCFAVEEQLQARLDIPVFHDDQHGTAVVVAAGLLNALRIVNKRPESIRAVVIGIGAAGVACTKMLMTLGVREILGVSLEGILHRDERYENPMHNWYAQRTNPRGIRGSVREALDGADVVIGVSGPGALNAEDLRGMAKDPIVFALANPEPEIAPDVALERARVLATGRSDYPNQINNVLCFPGLFRGVLDCRARVINEEMKLAAARAIASVVKPEELDAEYIVPSVFNHEVAPAVCEAVMEAAYRTGVARRARHAGGRRGEEEGLQDLWISGADRGPGS